MIDWSNTFESTGAISMLMLWLLFGFLSTFVNCDLQRLMTQNIITRHVISLLAFFFLFTLIDSKANLLTTWIKTIVVYVLFILLTKNKWYIVLPVLALLLVDQSLKRYKNEVTTDDGKTRIDNARSFLNKIIIVIILLGTLDYYLIQKAEYKNRFSFIKFFLGNIKPCKKSFPKIKRAKVF